MKKLFTLVLLVVFFQEVNAQCSLDTVYVTHVSCAGLCNGSVAMTVNNGVPPFTYDLQPGNLSSITGQWNGLCAGTYTATVTDGTACIATTTFIISEPTVMTISAISSTSPSCTPGCDGTFIFSSSGGVAPFVYTVSGSASITNNTITGCCSGVVYTVTVSDANLCTVNTTVFAQTPTPIIVSAINSTIPSCTPGCDGAFTLSSSGGMAPFVYAVSGTATITNNILTGCCSGVVYTVTVTDANACTGTTTAFAQAPNASSIVLTQSANSCTGVCNGTLQFSGGFIYTIYPYNLQQSSGLFNNLCGNQTYTVMAVDVNGCTTATQAYIGNVPNIPGVSVTSNVYDASCNQSLDGAIDITVSPNIDLNYLWSTGDTTQDISNIANGIYSLMMTDTNGNCLSHKDTVIFQGINCGTISGQVIWDSAGNCMYDTGDLYIPNRMIQLSTGDITLTDANGYFQFNSVPYGTHVINEMSSPNLFSNSCNQPNQVTINSSNNVSSNNLFKDSVGNNIDEDLWIYGTRYIPGYSPTSLGAYINLSIHNPSPIYIQNKLTLLLDPSLHYNSATVSPSSVVSTVNGDSITWFLNSPPFNWGYWSNNIRVYLDVPSTLTLGTLLTSCATLTPINISDVNMVNNSNCLTKMVATSFDPNDKTVQPVGLGSNGYITLQDSLLNYHIRFQNTGTAPAQNIYIMDTLSDKLDISSLQITGYSHPYQIEIINGHILKFKFINIMLPDSNANEPASHGFISYRIKQKPNNAPGNVIQNTAFIYFDFNSPVMTNTTVNTIMNPTSVNVQNTNDGLFTYPNPSKGLLHVRYCCSDYITNTFWFLNDAIGKTILSGEVLLEGKEYNTDVDVSRLSKGVYYLHIGRSVQKIIVE